MAKHEDILFEHLPGKKSSKPIKVKSKKPISVKKPKKEQNSMLKYLLIAIVILVVVGIAFKMTGFKIGKDKTPILLEENKIIKKIRETLDDHSDIEHVAFGVANDTKGENFINNVDEDSHSEIGVDDYLIKALDNNDANICDSSTLPKDCKDSFHITNAINNLDVLECNKITDEKIKTSCKELFN